ncbi:phosphonate metabolism protein/1,5-bisphosphokinase (PRPP-forming) PhnN [Brucella anthropi]|uniref:Ribose 1,5-bisphosphate phosphokinase PhnN n=1 Tax=Brucella anthropi TaxID=529 RepID=A0A6I0DUZ7_BRUAN|nr:MULTISPECIES: phosphonate metabolism protein/1,5-bisphosphokinase (PRPP-forming) PhnN [Brucella/Ochrobactrum group]QTN04039.1 phosphonate metabolism protein/1,5-bisphosphokinase (PRPP-forming) PhnN [Ochrobactrum sp. EEELCW01]KAB2738387.1 phosphonate metabolism protein/1,5-bisphosphokinase (PRPP-forming) PhnN [Brucella anthropi]KAB2760926.1 phosphonate metabolism protein/1,5-bisphosphokinase (PRPP-forming) PhnN [Brucella anthropi]KAB2772241.1 phosphonate metabolism protein/1,5-bisphosphokinas
MQSDMPKGCFVAVVGPSGAGKDTIMDAARVALAGDTRFHFVRRIITRPQMPGTEDHDSLDEASFATAAGEGAFALHWQAHGLSYGLPKSLEDEIAEGTVVIANVSRRVLGDIRRLYKSRSVVVITARPDVLAERLASRGRESREEITARLAREVSFDDDAGDVVTIDNSGDVNASTETFLRHLKEITVKTIA